MSEVIFEEIPGNAGNLGLITLNRPSALNALNHTMILSMTDQLKQWEKDSSIKAIVLQACPGRAFCAGGDVRAVYEKKIKNDSNLIQFFKDEYYLNRLIFYYQKPYISYLNGITMGGGAGISIHGSHRIGTENLIFAMPETSIGFFPDIGSSYFLSRLPDSMGLYLGLTGEKIDSRDCAELGIITQFISPDRFSELIKTLAENALPDKATVTKFIDSFAMTKSPAEILYYQNKIAENFQKNSVEDILASLKLAGDPWCQKTLEVLEAKSPLSLKVTFEELHQARTLNFDECMRMEFKIMQQFLLSNDFFEGIRALLVDKDRRPRWQPNTLAAVLPVMLAAFFPKIQEDSIR